MNWLALLLLAGAFWESKAPSDWTMEELAALFTDSPWAQKLEGPQNAPAVSAYLATAAPMLEAERDRVRRMRKKPAPDPLGEEYRAWLEENRATRIVLAIPIADPKAYSDSKETAQMEAECVMKIGRRKIKLTGHFPPSTGDPYLRLAFPREVKASDKSVLFELYVPGIAIPFRSVEFRVKDMMVALKLEL